jgi:two-component system sensor kinase FixL
LVGKPLVIVADAGGRVVFANSNCEALTGLGRHDLVGYPLWRHIDDEQVAQRVRAAVAHLSAGRPAADDEGIWRNGEGRPVLLRWSYTALRDADERLQSIIVTGYDTACSRLVTAELGRLLDRYQGILDTAVDGIITIDERGIVETFNRAAERIFGYSAAEVVGRNISMLMPSPHREAHDRYIDNYLTTHQKRIIGIGREVYGQHKDGTLFPLEIAVGEVIGPDGRLFAGIVRDITDRKKAEAEARRHMNELAHVMRLRSMGELASGLAHEVNQPLTAIISNAQACLRLLDNGRAEPELVREVLQQIARQGERAAEVIRRLRKYVEKGELEKAPSDINSSVVEVLKLLSHELQVHRVRVEVDIAPHLPKVPMDRVQIEQVLVNLIRNAIEAMEEDDTLPATLRIVTEEAPLAGAAGVRVAVRDNGPGFSADIGDQLFEAFYTTKPGGLGQGLSICRRIVEAHGGRIRAEPAQPGGAQFSFWLPLAAPA